MNRFLLNSPVLTAFGQWDYRGPLSLATAQAFFDQGTVISAIGHPATARYLGACFGREIPTSRIAVEMVPGDVALVFRLHGRLREGAVLDETALANLPYSFGLLERLA